VDTSVFRTESTDKDIDVLYIGRIEPQKNLDLLFSAHEELQATMTIIGEGTEVSTLQRKYQHLDARTTWIGRVPNKQLPHFLNRSKIYVLPSRYEGHPKTLLEAMACGLPVVGTDVPGIREVIAHNENGLLIGSDPRTLADTISRLLKDEELRARLGANAREYAINNYSLESSFRKELQLVQRVGYENELE
jgi:glycosyltransferase involved in cell wall biosynthesis